MNSKRVARICVAVLFTTLSACSVTHNPNEFRSKYKRGEHVVVLAEPFASVYSRLLAQTRYCFEEKRVDRAETGGVRIRKKFAVESRENAAQQSASIMIKHIESGGTLGLQTYSVDSYLAILDVKALSASETQVTSYNIRRRPVRRAMRMWVNQETQSCPRT